MGTTGNSIRDDPMTLFSGEDNIRLLITLKREAEFFLINFLHYSLKEKKDKMLSPRLSITLSLQGVHT